MNTNNTVSGFDQVKVIIAEADASSDRWNQEKAGPAARLKVLEGSVNDRVVELETQHRKLLRGLRKKLNRKIDAARAEHAQTIADLRAQIDRADEALRQSWEVREQKLQCFRGKLSFEQVVEATMPEDLRPNIIKVEGLETDLLIVQLKNAPKIGFVVWASGEQGTRWSITVGLNTPLSERRFLTCFCGSGCMDDGERRRHVMVLTDLCRRHGIEVLLGRKVQKDIDGVQIIDGEAFKEAFRERYPEAELKRLQGYLSMC